MIDNEKEAGAEFVYRRFVAAPRDLVFKAWTEYDRLKEWWGPKGFEWLGGTLDLRPGGLFHYGMRAPNGMEMWGKMAYREIVPPERIVFLNSFSDAEGNTIRNIWTPVWPLETLTVVTLEEQDGGTLVTLRGAPHEATEEERQAFQKGFGSMRGGFGGTFDQLEAYLAGLS